MISMLAYAALLLALVGTSVSVLLMYRRLRRLDAMLREYRAATETTAHALHAAHSSIDRLNSESRRLVTLLGEATNSGMAVLTRLNLAVGMPGPVQKTPIQWPLKQSIVN